MYIAMNRFQTLDDKEDEFEQVWKNRETLLDDVMKGDQSVFVRNDEIEYSWKIIDKIRKQKRKLYYYEAGSKGPKELEKFNRKHNVRWRV